MKSCVAKCHSRARSGSGSLLGTGHLLTGPPIPDFPASFGSVHLASAASRHSAKFFYKGKLRKVFWSARGRLPYVKYERKRVRISSVSGIAKMPRNSARPLPHGRKGAVAPGGGGVAKFLYAGRLRKLYWAKGRPYVLINYKRVSVPGATGLMAPQKKPNRDVGTKHFYGGRPRKIYWAAGRKFVMHKGKRVDV
jgi:hypothetical protein